MNELKVMTTQNVLGVDFDIWGSLEEPLFSAKQVAEWIEHSNARVMLSNVDEDEKVVKIAYTPGGNQEQWFLTEDGMYEILMQSRKPIAKAFKKEVKKTLKQMRMQHVEPRRELTATDQLRLTTESVLELDDRLTNIEQNYPIFPSEAKNLNYLVKLKVSETMRSMYDEHPDKKKIRSMLFKSIYGELKVTFEVSSYSSISRKEYERAIRFVNTWYPSSVTKAKIENGLTP